MDIDKNSFTKKKSGLRCTVRSSVSPITYYASSQNNLETISILAKVKKTNDNGVPMGTVNGLQKLNEYLCDIEDKLAPFKGIIENHKYIPALQKIAKSKVIPRGSYFNETSSDGQVKVFTQKGKNKRGTFQVFVEDYSVDKQGVTSEKKRMITVSGFFEFKEDADAFAEETYIEYETYGYYSRCVDNEKLKGLHQKSIVLSDKQTTFDDESEIDKELLALPEDVKKSILKLINSN